MNIANELFFLQLSCRRRRICVRGPRLERQGGAHQGVQHRGLRGLHHGQLHGSQPDRSGTKGDQAAGVGKVIQDHQSRKL